MNDVIKQTDATSGNQVQRGAQNNSLIPLIERAMTSNDIDPAKLEQLLTTYERWQSGEARRAFVAAMNAFRRDCPAVEKRGVTTVTKGGATASYARLVDAVNAIRGPLAENGLSFRWKTGQADGLISVTCIVAHVDGHVEETTLEGQAEMSGSKNAMQGIGSAVAYLERYTLFAALGLASGDMDDDGAGSGPGTDGDDPATGLITDKQMADVIALKDELGDRLDPDVFKSWLRDRMDAKDGKIENIPRRNVQRVFEKMEKLRSKISGAPGNE